MSATPILPCGTPGPCGNCWLAKLLALRRRGLVALRVGGRWAGVGRGGCWEDEGFMLPG